MAKTIQSGDVSLQEGEEYILFKDGFGVEHPVANLKHPFWCKRKIGIVRFESFRSGDQRVDGKEGVTVPFVKDKKTGIFIGNPIGVDAKTKSIKWRNYTLSGTSNYDLSIEQDRFAFIVLSNHPEMEGSPNKLPGKPIYKIVDYEVRAVKRLESRHDRRRALDISDKMSFTELVDISPILSINAEKWTQSTLIDEVQHAIENFNKNGTPGYKLFLDYYEHPYKHIITAFHKAVYRGVITRVMLKDNSVQYSFGGVPLGITENEAINELTKPNNAHLLNKIIVETETLQKNSFAANTKTLAADIESQKVAEKDAEIAALKARMAEMEQQNAGKEVSVKIGANLLEVKQGIPELTKEYNETDLSSKTEDELKGIAKALAVKNYQVFKREKLIQKITEAKAEQEVVQT